MTLQSASWIAPDLAAFEAMAETARAALPEPFRSEAMRIALCIEDFASREILDAMEIADAFELTGLYDGVPLTEKASLDQPQQPDTIWIYRRPILDEWAARANEPLGHLVAHVFVHELAHHFGWSDDDIAAIDPWWN